MSAELTARGRHRRTDALRNRERVVAAAAAVFAERGLAAGIPEIASRAGVGKATVYRSFPTREHLVAAVVAARLGEVEAVADAALARADASAGLDALVVALVDGMAHDRCIADALALVHDDAEVLAATRRLRSRIERVLDRAQRDGGVRPDVGYDDLMALIAGVRRTSARRHAALVLDALRPHGARPLPAD
jgi:AcrR family transcriptional regulator